MNNLCNEQELRKRCIVYTITDERIKQLIQSFINDNKYACRGVPDKYENVYHYNAAWASFITKYLETGDVNDLPESWAKSEVFPMLNIANIGDAGTGKTTCMVNIQSRMLDHCTTGPVNKTSNAFTDAHMSNNLPNGKLYERQNNTWHKLLNLQFHKKANQKAINEIITDCEINEAYTKYLNVDCKDIAQETRKLVKLVLKKSYTYLINVVIKKMFEEFLTKGGNRMRLEQPEAAPFYQPEELSFPWMKQMKRTNPESRSVKLEVLPFTHILFRPKIYNDGLHERQEAMKFIHSQDQFRRFIQTSTPWETSLPYNGAVEEKALYPPVDIVHPIIMSEEDGRSAAILKIFFGLCSRINCMLYNPPYYHLGPVVYLASGSTTQSMVIGTSASPLNMLESPGVASDISNTLIIKSKLFRRDLSVISGHEAMLYRLMSQALESNVTVSPYTLTSLQFREEFPHLSEDPSHHIKDGARFYVTHKEVDAFYKNMQETNPCSIHLNDIVYISTNIMSYKSENKCATRTDFISKLSPSEAGRNLNVMWKAKNVMYNKCNLKAGKNIGVIRNFSPDFDAEISNSLLEAAHANLNLKEINRGKKRKVSDDDDDDSPTTKEQNLGKKYIRAPASLILAESDHLKHRYWIDAFETALQHGDRFLKCNFESSARAGDQNCSFYYKGQYDFATFYFTDPPDNAYVDQLMEYTAACTVHLPFVQTRSFVQGERVTHIGDARSEVCLRGVLGTPTEIRQNFPFTNSTPIAFKLMTYIKIIEEFCRWYLITRKRAVLPSTISEETIRSTLKNSLLTNQNSDDYSDLSWRYLNLVDEISNDPSLSLSNVSKYVGEAEACLNILDNHFKKDFMDSRQIEFFLYQSPLYKALYQYIKYTMRLPLRELKNSNDNLVLLGDALTHPAMMKEVKKARHESIANLGQCHSTHWQECNMASRTYPRKSEEQMMEWALLSHHPDLYFSSSAVLTVGGVLIVNTQPHCRNIIEWEEVLHDPYKKNGQRFGYVTRDLKELKDRQNNYHEMFVLPTGEGMHLPRPILNANEGPCNSAVVMKVRHWQAQQPPELINFACERNYDSIEDEKDILKRRDPLEKNSAMVGLGCPIMPDIASTYHAAQGATLNHHTFINLSKMQKRCFQETNGASSTAPLLLVGLTRNVEAQQVHLAGVDEVATNILQSQKIQEASLSSKRQNAQILARYEHFR